MAGRYVLVDKVAVAEPDLMKWAKIFESGNRHVATDTIGDVRVSTVFLGLDHNFEEEGPPLVFETLIFGGPCDGGMWRYSTWKEAEDGHRVAVEKVKTSLH